MTNQQMQHHHDKGFLNGLEAAMRFIARTRCDPGDHFSPVIKLAYDRCYDGIMSIHEEFLSKSKEKLTVANKKIIYDNVLKKSAEIKADIVNIPTEEK